MEVHIFHPNENFNDDAFCAFVRDQYQIPVSVHEYDKLNNSLILDFLQKNKKSVLIGSLIFSEDVSVSLGEEDIYYEISKAIIKGKQNYLGGMVILQSEVKNSASQITPTAILNLYRGMLELPNAS